MEILKRIELNSFSNQIAYKMASQVIDLAESKNQSIAIEISRLNHSIFLYLGNEMPMDKLNWLRRKANVAKQFEESSLSVKMDLIEGNMSLDKTFGLDDKNFVAKGGAIPIFVKGAGMVATICVSGLNDEEDHNIIIEALKESFY